MKVFDVMSKNVDFVTTDTKVKDVSLLIFGRGINGVPVCKGKKVVGFITERDILANFYPSISEYAEDPFNEGNFEKMEGKVDEIFELTADKIMSTQVTSVTPNTPILKAQSRMFIEKVGRLPVVDKKGNLIGLISKGDIFRTLVGNKLLFTENEEYNDWLSKTYYASVDIKDRLEHEIPDLLKVFTQNEVKTILDIGCGTGDHAIDFAKRGFEVVGIDRSKEMIREANRRKQVLSKEATARLKFYCSDLEGFIPKIKTTFDAVLFMGNTISHNPYNYKDLIKEASQKLSDHGVMIFQITNFDKILKTKNRILGFNFATNKAEVNKEYAFIEFYDNPSDHNKTILKTFAVLTSDGGKRWKSTGVRNSMMAYLNKDKMRSALKRDGFSKISVYGGFFDGRHWDYLFRKSFRVLESDWLNVIAVK